MFFQTSMSILMYMVWLYILQGTFSQKSTLVCGQVPNTNEKAILGLANMIKLLVLLVHYTGQMKTKLTIC